MKTRGCLLVGALLLLFSLPLFASGGTEKPVTIRFVHHDADSSPSTKPINDAIAAYAKTVANKYTLVQETAPSDTLKSKIQIDMSSNNLPDIMWYWGAASDASALAKSGLVLDVDDFFAKSGMSRADFKDLWDGVTIEGKNYCLPVDNLISSWVINKSLFKQYGLAYPKTYNDVMEAAKTFNQHGIITLGFGSKGGNPSNWVVDMVYSQYPGSRKELLDISSKWTVDTDNFRKALGLFEDLINAHAFPDDMVANGDWGPYWALFTSGKAAISWAWSGMIAGLRDAKFEWELIDQPQVNGTNHDTSKDLYAYSGAGIMISKKSFNDPKKQAAIIDFVKFYFSDDMQRTMLYSNGVIPTRQNVSYDASKLDPIVVQVMKYVEGRKPFLTHLSTIPVSSVWVDYESGLDEFFSKNMTPGQYVDYVQASMKKNK
jgi:raffinose/stachyose/melibiose transport system substrate-binding protein